MQRMNDEKLAKKTLFIQRSWMSKQTEEKNRKRESMYMCAYEGEGEMVKKEAESRREEGETQNA